MLCLSISCVSVYPPSLLISLYTPSHNLLPLIEQSVMETIFLGSLKNFNYNVNIALIIAVYNGNTTLNPV